MRKGLIILLAVTTIAFCFQWPNAVADEIDEMKTTRHSTQGPGEPGYCESLQYENKVLLMAAGSGNNGYEAFTAAKAVGFSCVTSAYKLTSYKTIFEATAIQPLDNHPDQFVATVRMKFQLP